MALVSRRHIVNYIAILYKTRGRFSQVFNSKINFFLQFSLMPNFVRRKRKRKFRFGSRTSCSNIKKKEKKGDRSDEKDWKTVMIARQREREREMDKEHLET